MTKKDYIKAAKIVKARRKYASELSYIKSLHEQKICNELEATFIELFTADNHRFNKDMFLKACHLESE